MPRAALERVRAICLELPGALETTSFGHPTWKARRKAFAVFEKYRGDGSLALKADPGGQHAVIQTDARFYRTPYVGQHGWVSFKLQGRIP
jgi:predicted DNA-binding protein (MmcQ/YjbR family)